MSRCGGAFGRRSRLTLHPQARGDCIGCILCVGQAVRHWRRHLRFRLARCTLGPGGRLCQLMATDPLPCQTYDFLNLLQGRLPRHQSHPHFRYRLPSAFSEMAHTFRCKPLGSHNLRMAPTRQLCVGAPTRRCRPSQQDLCLQTPRCRFHLLRSTRCLLHLSGHQPLASHRKRILAFLHTCQVCPACLLLSCCGIPLTLTNLVGGLPCQLAFNTGAYVQTCI